MFGPRRNNTHVPNPCAAQPSAPGVEDRRQPATLLRASAPTPNNRGASARLPRPMPSHMRAGIGRNFRRMGVGGVASRRALRGVTCQRYRPSGTIHYGGSERVGLNARRPTSAAPLCAAPCWGRRSWSHELLASKARLHTKEGHAMLRLASWVPALPKPSNDNQCDSKQLTQWTTTWAFATSILRSRLPMTPDVFDCTGGTALARPREGHPAERCRSQALAFARSSHNAASLIRCCCCFSSRSLSSTRRSSFSPSSMACSQLGPCGMSLRLVPAMHAHGN